MRSYYLPYDIQEKIIEKIVGDSISSVVIKSKSKFDDKAKQRGRKLVNIESMDYNLQYLFKNMLKSSENFVNELEKEARPIVCDPNDIELEFLQVHGDIIRGIGLDVELRIVEKDKDSSGFITMAYHTKENKHIISYNRKSMSYLFSYPYGERAIDILIHELGHIDEAAHDTMEYVNAVTKFGAKIARYFMKKSVNVESKKVESKSGVTLCDSVKNLLKEQSGAYLSLNEIYGHMNANTDGAKAGIRGVLNRNCPNIFDRHPEGGKYRLNVC